MDSDDTTARAGAADEGGDATRVGRRAVLAAGAASLLGSGCLQQSQSLVDRSTPRQLSVTIKTMPADDDPRATMIARSLSERLSAVGIDASVALLGRRQLYQDILLNQSFDIYVARFPHFPDPDALRPLLHSGFTGEAGWGNPFGYTSLELDGKLEWQRRQTGAARVGTLRDVERIVARDQPFTVVAFPEEIRTARRNRLVTPSPDTVHTALRYLAMHPTEPATSLDDGKTSGTAAEPSSTLRVTLGDARPTRNLNPLSVAFRSGSTITDLLYDSLGRWIDGRVRPWLAASWTWEPTPDADGPRARLTVREDARWHDGTPLTAADVEFSYRFLRDTSLGRAENPVPAPNYRGEISLVESVERDDGDVVVQFRPVNRRVAARAFTVPILPEAVWAEQSGQATIGGVDTGRPVTKALIWNNRNPLGSGPLQFERATQKESLVLERFPDHFLHDADDESFGPYAGGMEFERLVFDIVPSSQAAVKLVGERGADVTGSPLDPEDVSTIGRSGGLSLRIERPNAFYHVGYNATIPPTSNVRFRRAVAHLLDKGHLVDEVFGGYARPAATPLARDGALSPALRWEETDPATPFPGSEGLLDVDQARELFTNAGYPYVNGKGLLSR
jgi:peptide/nickel transport system substrate-binding protein